jgi:hypothetical protein
MQAPFVKVIADADKKDLSEYVESFSYEESMEKENMATIVLKEEFSLDLVDSEYLVPAKKLNIQFGFIGKVLSDTQQVVIGDIATRYSTRVKVTLKCYDHGLSMKKTVSNRVWKNVKGSDIAKEIAAKYGLDSQIVASPSNITSEPQGNRSDFEFLKYLAESEKSEKPYVFYVTSKTLVYKPLNFAQQSSITYKYGEDDVVSFYPVWKEISANPMVNETATMSVDPDDKSIINSLLKRGDEEDTSLGEDILYVYNAAGKLIREEGGGEAGSNQTTGKVVSSPSEGVDALSNRVKSRRKVDTIKILEGDLTVVLNPKIRVGMIVSVSGLSKRHTGNWYCKTVRHDVNKGLSIISLGKDGMKTSAGLDYAVESSDVNTSVGDRQVDSTKQLEIVVFDKNGNELRTELQDADKFQPPR